MRQLTRVIVVAAAAACLAATARAQQEADTPSGAPAETPVDEKTGLPVYDQVAIQRSLDQY